MFYPYRQDGNAKESMLNNSGPSVLDPGGTGRPFASSFASGQVQSGNPGGFHHGGNLPGLHNVQASYNMQNIQNAISSRNPGMGGVPSSAGQPAGNMASTRFTTTSLQGGVPQMSHAGLHTHAGMGNRGGVNVVGGHTFGNAMNGLGTGPGTNNPGGAGGVGNPRGTLGGGLSVGPLQQMGGTGARMAASGGVSMAGGGSVSIAGAGGGNMNRSLNANVVNMAMNGTRLGNIGLGPLGSNASLGVQGPGRPGGAGVNMLQQGVNLPSSSYNMSSDVLASMMSRAGAPLLGGSYSPAPGAGMPGQQQGANGQLGSLSMGNDGGSNEGLAFDMNDFPQLSQRPASAAPGLPSPAGGRKLVAANAIIQQNTEFSIQNEDFPALPGYKGGSSDMGGDLHSKEQHHENSMASLQQFAGQVSGLPGAAGVQQVVANLRANQQYEQLVSQHHFQQQALQSQLRVGGIASQHVGGAQQSTVKDAGLKATSGQPDQFGLLGLLSVIRMSDPDLTTLALGTDLTTLGLNLNSRENLYKTFASPWAEGPTRGEPEFTLPACYVQPAPRLQPGYFSKFQLDTLFYIFYSMPNDEAQLYAADELGRKGWSFHKEHQMWFTRVPNSELSIKTNSYERGSYYYFDPSVWETGRKDNFVLQYEMLEPTPQIIPSQR